MRLSFSNPWWVVVGAVIGLFVCNGPVLAFTFGVFLKPIMADMGWQRGTASFALAVGGICSSLMVPVFDRLMERWGIRAVALPGLMLYALLMCLLGFSPASLGIFTVLFALTEAAGAIQGPIGYAKAITAWFDRRRGLALGAAMSGIGLGGFVMPQLAQLLIDRVGWRGAYPILGLLTLAVAFPAVALWIREPRPGEGERSAEAAGADLSGLTSRVATGTPRLWVMGAAFFCVAIAINGAVAHVVPLLTDHGVSVAAAAATMGMFGLATMTGRLLASYLVDRLFAPFVATLFFLAPIAGLVLLASASGVLPTIGVILLGLGLGTEIDLIAFLVSRYIGQRAFGEIYGGCLIILGLGSAIGRFLGGLVFDLAG
ncbi:MAG: MFS transporter, partial [Alphaproteobacteria bacterium]|nr:MFS transporter [Alphaproteobacteria bacterium]